MTDEELLIWLRVEDTNLTDFAAARIEELIEESGRRLALARSEGVARVEQFERTEALTAKLAKAVEALGLIVVDNTWGLEHETYMRCVATLAEIKGDKP